MSDKFAPRDPGDVSRLVDAYPLAWVVSGAGIDQRATLLPLRPNLSGAAIVSFIGHFARANDQVALLRAQPEAMLLFAGPQGYISPSWMKDRTQAPTWNYAAARFAARIAFFDDEEETRAHLDDLVKAMERRAGGDWSIGEMKERFTGLAKRIIGFRADVLAQHAKFKLGQDERDDVFADICAGLEGAGSTMLLSWMQEFNTSRP